MKTKELKQIEDRLNAESSVQNLKFLIDWIKKSKENLIYVYIEENKFVLYSATIENLNKYKGDRVSKIRIDKRVFKLNLLVLNLNALRNILQIKYKAEYIFFEYDTFE